MDLGAGVGSLDGAKRNPGAPSRISRPLPDCAALHPGYACSAYCRSSWCSGNNTSCAVCDLTKEQICVDHREARLLFSDINVDALAGLFVDSIQARSEMFKAGYYDVLRSIVAAARIFQVGQ